MVNRWRRWGKDRLYVEWTDGSKVGFWDLEADSGHPASAEHEHTLLSAVTEWKSSQRSEASTEDEPRQVTQTEASLRPEQHDIPDERVTAPRPWVDLATNPAGAETRERADAARNAAPVRTAFARILGVHTDERA